MHDFERIPVRDLHVTQGRARHNLEIPLNSDALRVEPKLHQHCRDAYAGSHSLWLSIDPDGKEFGDAH